MSRGFQNHLTLRQKALWSPACNETVHLSPLLSRLQQTKLRTKRGLLAACCQCPLAGLTQFPWEKPELTEKQKKQEEKRLLKKMQKEAKRRGD